MKHTGKMASSGMIYIRRFMMTGSGIQVVLKLLPQNFRGCSVVITDTGHL
jgi:hypothetical protein